jgi:hypothetical protein
MPIMIWVAIIIEGAIESWPDMGILLGKCALCCACVHACVRL